RPGARGSRVRDRIRARPAALAADGGSLRPRLGDLVRDALVGAVIPRHRDEGGLAKVESATERREELTRGRHREPSDPERPSELDEARISELRGEGTAEDPPLVRLDDPQAIVDEDHADDRRAHPFR